MTFFPAIIEGPGSDGGFAADVVGTPVVGQGDSAVAAAENAAVTLQEVIDDCIRDGEPIPEPGAVTDADLTRGVLAMLNAHIPAQAA